MPHIGILLFDGFEELDAVGPWEVLAFWTKELSGDGWSVSTFAAGGAQVTAAKGLRVVPDHSYETVPALDVLVYPGGQGTRAQVRDAAHLDWLRAQRPTVPLMTSVCTGSLVYAAAGLLTGRPATTYHSSFDELTALDPSIRPQPDARFVDDGDIVTAAGVSAGIDMALHLVDRLAGTDRARQVRRGIQYDPEPPV